MKYFSRLLLILFLSAFINNGFSQAYRLQSAKTVMGPFNGFAGDISFNRGSLYWTGCYGFFPFNDTMSIGDTVLTVNTDAAQTFLAKFDTVGNLKWAATTSGSAPILVNQKITDGKGNSYLTGYVDRGTAVIGATTVIIPNSENNAFFVAKCDSNGQFIWAHIDGANVDGDGLGIAIDKNGYIYVSGCYFGDSLQVGPKTIHGGSQGGFFLAKYDSAGNINWLKGGTQLMNYSSHGFTPPASKVVCDSSGNIFVAGAFYGSNLIFDNVSLINTLGSGNGSNCYLAKFTNSGQFVWAKSYGGDGGDEFSGIVANNTGILLEGYFYDHKLVFGTDTLVNADNAALTSDAFIVKFDTSGNVFWAKRIGGTGNEYIDELRSDLQGKAFITGDFSSDSLVFGSTTLRNTINNNEYYVAAYNQNGTAFWADGGNGRNMGGLSVEPDNDGNLYTLCVFNEDSIKLDNQITLHVFPGENEGVFLAKYGTCSASSSGTITGPAAICAGDTAIFTNNITGGIWSSRDSSVANIFANGNAVGKMSGITQLIYSVINNCTTDSVLFALTVDTIANPVITSTGANLAVNIQGSYQWYLNDTAIVGATQSTFNAIQSGSYSVVVTNGPCSAASQPVQENILGVNSVIQQKIKMVPNPTNNLVTIQGVIADKIMVFNSSGQLVAVLYNTNQVSMAEFANGLYLIQITNLDGEEIDAQTIEKQ